MREVTVFRGSPRKNGNTNALTDVVAGKLKDRGYGGQRGPSLWAGKHLALITTCGYPPEKGADLLEEGVRRYCKHSQLKYEGMLCGRHMGYDTEFMDAEKERQAQTFAEGLHPGS